jgi:hypothetical protein
MGKRQVVWTHARPRHDPPRPAADLPADPGRSAAGLPMSSWEERMSARAGARREAEVAAERERWAVEEAAERAARWVEQQTERQRMLATGPGCAICYAPEPRLQWNKFGLDYWVWQHLAPIRPVVEIDPAWGGRFVYCTHDCHRQEDDGRYCTDSPPILLASVE